MSLALSPMKGPRCTNGIKTCTVAPPTIEIQAVQINGQPHAHYLYENGDDFFATTKAAGSIIKKNLDGWSLGPKITKEEWVAGRPEKKNLPACVTRGKGVTILVRLVSQTARTLKGMLKVVPSLNKKRDKNWLKPVEVYFDFPANQRQVRLIVPLAGEMPDWIGEYDLYLEWDVQPQKDAPQAGRFRFKGPKESRITIYCIAGAPCKPGYDSQQMKDAGEKVDLNEGTLTGTRQRLNRLMALLHKKDLRHRYYPPASGQNLLEDPDDHEQILWLLHKGISDSTPPYFDPGHDEHLTADGTGLGLKFDVRDQWLAWVGTGDRWNDLACIGHVQLLKTMAASIGIFARRAWVCPCTPLMPDGSRLDLLESDLYYLGAKPDETYSMEPPTKLKPDELPRKTRGRYWGKFTIPGIENVTHWGRAVLVEKDGLWQGFEACLRTPGGRFLPGGFETYKVSQSREGKDFEKKMGFHSAFEVLRWWCRTPSGGFQRFVCWYGEAPAFGRKYNKCY